MTLEINTVSENNEGLKELSNLEAKVSKIMTKEGGDEKTKTRAKEAIKSLTNREKLAKRDELLTKLIGPAFNPNAMRNSRVNMQPAFEETFDKSSTTFDFSGLTQNQTMVAARALMQGIKNRTISSLGGEINVKFNTADGGNIGFIAPLIIGAQQAYGTQTINMIPNQGNDQKDQFQHILPILSTSGLMDNVVLKIPSQDYENYKDKYGKFIADGGTIEKTNIEEKVKRQPTINLNQSERIKE